jgi:polyferredoxin
MKLNSAKISQYFFLCLFLFLFVITEYRGKDEISLAVNGFFRANPLVVVSFVLAQKALTFLLIPGMLLTVFSALLGRFFCGWICPLGTIIDLVGHRIGKSAPIRVLHGTFKYYLLATLLFAALFNVNVTGVLDPLAILVRVFTFVFYPLLGYAVRSGWVGMYYLIGDKRDFLDPLYGFLRDYVIPFRETFYPLAFLTLALFLFILFLERFEQRNWCKNLCPLGTLLGLLGRFALFKRVPARLCADCGDCREMCPTAFDGEILQKENCILCMDCKLKCKWGRVRFPVKKMAGKRKKETVPFIGRRVFVTGLVSGFLLSRAFSFKPAQASEKLLRPPGVKGEDEFLKTCVRCGECMKVCLRSALYPSFLQAGFAGLYTPMLVPRLGYCEYNCNLCGQVCPTAAIPNLPVEEKKKRIIGTAVVDKNLCLPYAKKISCIVCEEHCPIPEKAIRFEVVRESDYTGRTVTLKKPYVIDELCNGCGICENKCPLEGKSAIEVFSRVKRKT